MLEPNGTTTVNVAPTMETDYAYDTIGNLLNVDQWGGVHGTGPDHARSFSYDAISRLIASNNPESASAATPPAQTCTGTTSGTHWTGCYTYDANSNLKVKTDNRGITISYSYDALNRLTGKTYSDATPAVSFSYDTSSISGSSNDVGEMTQASVASGTKVLAKTTPFAYDTMGRLLTEQQCTPVNCTGTAYSVSSTYDYAGKQLSESFPSNALGSGQPLALTFTYDQAERVLSAGSNWSSSGDAKHPPTLFKASSNTSVPAYGPMGLQNAALGVNSTSGTTTASMQLAYDNRSRVSSGIYTAGASAISGSTSTGSVVISGNEASITKANSSGAATFFPSLPQYGGTHQVCQQVWIPPNPGPGYWETQCTNQPNNGSTQVTIQSQPAFTVTVNWASSQALAAIASAVAAALNTSGSPVAAVANSNGSVTITAVTTGVETNYAVTLNGSVVLY